MNLYSKGQVAAIIGVKYTKLTNAINLRNDMPLPEFRIGTRKILAFTEADILAICDWFEGKGISVTRPNFPAYNAMLHSTA